VDQTNENGVLVFIFLFFWLPTGRTKGNYLKNTSPGNEVMFTSSFKIMWNLQVRRHLREENLNYKMVAMDDFSPSYIGLPNFPGFEFLAPLIYWRLL